MAPKRSSPLDSPPSSALPSHDDKEEEVELIDVEKETSPPRKATVRKANRRASGKFEEKPEVKTASKKKRTSEKSAKQQPPPPKKEVRIEAESPDCDDEETPPPPAPGEEEKSMKAAKHGGGEKKAKTRSESWATLDQIQIEEVAEGKGKRKTAKEEDKKVEGAESEEVAPPPKERNKRMKKDVEVLKPDEVVVKQAGVDNDQMEAKSKKAAKHGGGEKGAQTRSESRVRLDKRQIEEGAEGKGKSKMAQEEEDKKVEGAESEAVAPPPKELNKRMKKDVEVRKPDEVVVKQAGVDNDQMEVKSKNAAKHGGGEKGAKTRSESRVRLDKKQIEEGAEGKGKSKMAKEEDKKVEGAESEAVAPPPKELNKRMKKDVEVLKPDEVVVKKAGVDNDQMEDVEGFPEREEANSLCSTEWLKGKGLSEVMTKGKGTGVLKEVKKVQVAAPPLPPPKERKTRVKKVNPEVVLVRQVSEGTKGDKIEASLLMTESLKGSGLSEVMVRKGLHCIGKDKIIEMEKSWEKLQLEEAELNLRHLELKGETMMLAMDALKAAPQ